MRKQYYALICVVVALLLLFGCSAKQTVDRKIEKWADKASTNEFFVFFDHKSKEFEELDADLQRAILLGGGTPEHFPWGNLTIHLRNFVVSGDKAERIDIEKIKNKDPKTLEAFIKKTRTDFINLIESLDLESDIKYKYMDFKTELQWLGDGAEITTIMEINEYGKFKNRMFLLGLNEEELEKARNNYESDFLGGRKQLDGTYIYTLRVTNKNEKIPLYVHNITLVHKRKGALEYRELHKGSDFKRISGREIVAPWKTEDFQLQVDGYHGKYGSLQCRYRVENSVP